MPGPGSARTRLVAVIAVALAVQLLRMTRTVTMPIVAGLLVAALLWPVLGWWRRILPRPLALLATVLVVVATVAALFGALTWSSARVGERMLERRERIEVLQREVEQVTGSVGDVLGTGGAGDTVATGGESPAGASRPAGAGEGGYTRRMGRAAIAALSALTFIIAFMALALAEADDARAKIRQRFPAVRADRLLDITHEVARAMQRYFVVKSLTSFITGTATLLITLAFGLDFAPVWGLLAFLLEYVPTIGSVLAVIPPALYAAIQFDGYVRPLSLTATLTVAQLVLGNYVDPKIEGRFLALSPFVVLASILFWTWVWGPAGSLLGVPLTVAITTVARHFEGTRWIWAILTAPNGGSNDNG